MIPSIQQYYPSFEKDIIEACQQSTVSTKLNEAMTYSLQAGGKRVRPLLALMTCDELGGSPNDCHPVALALEMIHTYSLIHDDLPCMDDDDLRRGKPTNHKVFGESHAVLAGDALLTLAFETLARTTWDIHPKTKLQIIQTISQAAGNIGMVGGQALDLEFENQNSTLQQLQKIHSNKTGKLITASVVAGALTATDDPSTLESIKTFGQSIGLAFQIADDILDVTQTSETLGKDAGSDVDNHKSTYPSIMGIEKAKETLNNLYNDALSALNSTGRPCSSLQSLAQFIVERNS